MSMIVNSLNDRKRVDGYTKIGNSIFGVKNQINDRITIAFYKCKVAKKKK
jgi:hypothetical protein